MLQYQRVKCFSGDRAKPEVLDNFISRAKMSSARIKYNCSIGFLSGDFNFMNGLKAENNGFQSLLTECIMAGIITLSSLS